MFIDEVEIWLMAGSGGSGALTFRTEKHVPRGGPDGGDGGHGGSVVFEVDSNLSTLLDYRPGKKYRAERGENGMGKRQYGKNGPDLVLKVPPGTQVFDAESGELLADLSHVPQKEVLAAGGRGGRGNVHFVTSVHQTPKFAEKGEPGEERRVKLSLKLLADVGLLGFPNVGKSTLLAAVSAARPKIADYPFTTLVPNLGVVPAADHHNFVMADVPGLIENASEGAGLGIQFLKHLERTRLLVHLLDVSGLSGRDPLEDFGIINRELDAFSEDLAKLPQIVVFSRIDVLGDRTGLVPLRQFFEARGLEVFPISAVTGEGVRDLILHVWTKLQEIPKEVPKLSGVVHITNNNRADDDPKHFTITRDDEGVLVVSGKALERVVAMTDMGNEYAVRRLQRQLERWGVFTKLKTFGAQEGDTVRIRTTEFDYVDEDAWDAEEVEDDEEFETDTV
ncbi:GTPase ObgE [Armatimonas rosea]|uniref:GTPase Obg n=1 Tax=Armatimonas rosea TaxID=685828 RepID=A0A7W9SN02_ARMRO|nr:GTPase ObgE [Armatimonas rosea]MBB6049330.1 GTP-binding protein [Armatimonas rosea]